MLSTKYNFGNDIYNPDALSKRLIDDFKKHEIYKCKSEAERKEIIQYLIDKPDAEERNPKIITQI